MKKGIYRISVLMLIAVIVGGLNSCTHKDLVYPDPSRSRLTVKFDWRNAPDANPSAMAFYLYDRDGKTPIRFLFQNSEGGDIRVPAGDYLAMCLNADLTDWAVIEREESMDEYKISTLDATELQAMGISTRGIPRAPATESERIAATPGMLWSYTRSDVSIPVAYEKQTIVMYPEEKVCHYTVDVYPREDIKEYNKGVDAMISGMSEGYHTGRDCNSKNRVTHTFHLQRDEKDDCLRSEFLTFGAADDNVKHYVSLYLIDKEGNGRNLNVDVSDQVDEAPDPKHVHIVIRDLDLPEPHKDEPGMGGLKPDVNDWQSVNINLHM